jgi:RNA 3'-terminal phosphate cyclase (ATP)
MLELDGGEGGGQLVRTALSLAVLDGRAFELSDVRAGRPEPGLRPQHLAAVELAATLSDATVEGDAVGAERLRFEPAHPARPVDVDLDVGTAGSLPLLFDVAVPLGPVLDAPLSASATGGTDVAWSPPLDYLRRVKLPTLARAGLRAAVSVERRGFFPAGGGRATLRVEPARPSGLERLELVERGSLDAVTAYATASDGLADAEVAERLAGAAADALADLPVRVDEVVAYDGTRSPGAVVVLAVRAGDARAGFSALGERGVPAERVAERAASDLRAWLDGDAPVDEHLADQLVVPLALCGGRVRVPRVTAHLRSNVALVRAFDREVSLSVDESGADGGSATLSAPGPAADSDAIAG